MFISCVFMIMDYLIKTFEIRPKECYIETLPDEILLKVFKNLSTRWLCRALLVNRHWRRVGEDPSLWRRFLLAVGSQKVKNLADILKCARFSHLEQLLLMSFDPYDCEESNIDTKAILQSSIKRLEIRFVDMRTNMREVSMLGESLSMLTIHCCPIEQDQADQMFSKFKEGTCLRELCIINPLINGTEENTAGDGLSKVSPDILGRGLAKIRCVKLHEVCLTVAQINMILTCIDNDDTALKSLDVYDSINSKLSEASSKLLASSLNKLESLTMYNACLGRKTLPFLEKMAEETQLQHLNFRSNSLRGIHPGILARAFHSLTSLNIEDTDITSFQSEAFFQNLKENGGNQLKYVAIGHNDLSSVDPQTFAGALKNIAKVNINATSITKDQVEALFKEILIKSSSLKELNLSTNDFSTVNTTLMARAINKLEKAFMFYTGLTEHQVEEILNLGLRETNLLHLDLRHNLSKNSPNKLTKYIRSYVDEILL